MRMPCLWMGSTMEAEECERELLCRARPTPLPPCARTLQMSLKCARERERECGVYFRSEHPALAEWNARRCREGESACFYLLYLTRLRERERERVGWLTMFEQDARFERAIIQIFCRTVKPRIRRFQLPLERQTK